MTTYIVKGAGGINQVYLETPPVEGNVLYLQTVLPMSEAGLYDNGKGVKVQKGSYKVEKVGMSLSGLVDDTEEQPTIWVSLVGATVIQEN